MSLRNLANEIRREDEKCRTRGGGCRRVAYCDPDSCYSRSKKTLALRLQLSARDAAHPLLSLFQAPPLAAAEQRALQRQLARLDDYCTKADGRCRDVRYCHPTREGCESRSEAAKAARLKLAVSQNTSGRRPASAAAASSSREVRRSPAAASASSSREARRGPAAPASPRPAAAPAPAVEPVPRPSPASLAELSGRLSRGEGTSSGSRGSAPSREGSESLRGRGEALTAQAVRRPPRMSTSAAYRRAEDYLNEAFRRAPEPARQMDASRSFLRRCADLALIPCRPERCGRDPYDQEEFSAEELENDCVAYPRTGDEDTCMRPSNFVQSILSNPRHEARDPFTRQRHCP